MKPHEAEHSEVDDLRDEIHQLERRVEALEHGAQPRIEAGPQMAPLLTIAGPAEAAMDFSLPTALPAVGRAILGLAGAYLLRGLAESGSAPRLPVVAAAILYAASWLVFALRVRSRDNLAGTTYGITAALIFMPLLWEATTSLGVLSAGATACILTGFVGLVFALTWPENAGGIATLTTLASALTALGLMVRTGSLVPFVVALLVIACIVEAGVGRRHQRNMNVAVALIADLAIWILLYVMTRPGGVSENYTPVAPAVSIALCSCLFLIYAATIAWRVVARRRLISAFEATQLAAAFAMASGGALAVTHGSAAPSVGALSAIASAICYFTAFIRFPDSPRRNHQFFASCGLALSFVACILILPESLLTEVWGATAVIAALAGAKASHRTLAIHSLFYLGATGLTSGIPGSIVNAFAGSSLTPATPALWIVAVAATCCYAAWGRTPAKASVVPALLSAVSIGALLILAGIPLIAGRPTPSLLAAMRTVVTCALALSLRFAGLRADRRELIWVSYAAIALGTVKLMLEDFPQSHPAALAVSLVCYGAFLILAPKITGKRAKILP